MKKRSGFEEETVSREKTLTVFEQHFMQHARNKKGYVHAKRVKIKEKSQR